MNGIERVQLQELAGVRGLVEDIDGLRLCLGFENVKLLTPKAEITVRKGEVARIPLVVWCYITDADCEITLALPVGYPKVPFEIQDIKYSNALAYDEEKQAHVASLQEHEAHREGMNIHSVVDLVRYLKNLNIVQPSDASEDFGAGPAPAPDTRDKTVIVSSDEKSLIRLYSCRLCRREIFSDRDLDIHNTAMTCSTVFLRDPVQRPDNASEKGGKICCPHCSAKLGSWNWLGTQCSCKSLG